MGREKSIAVRFAAVGGDAVKGEMRGIGVAGRDAMNQVAASTAPASAGMETVGQSVDRTRMALEAMAAKAANSAAALRSAATSVTPLQAQINAATGVSAGQSAAEILRQGQALDTLRAKYNPVFGVIRQYRQEVASIRSAHLEGAISANEMASAISRSRQAALGSITAYKAMNGQVTQFARSADGSARRMQMMAFQLNDIGVSLAGGMNPLMVMAQQGTQIQQIYGFGNGGVAGAFKDVFGMIMRIPGPLKAVGIAAGIGAVAIGGLTNEINGLGGAQVSFGDTALAVWQGFIDGLSALLAPVTEKFGEWFSGAWDAVVDGVKWAGNMIVNGFTIAFEAVTTVGGAAFSAIPTMASALPDALTGIWERIKSGFWSALSWMQNKWGEFLISIAGQASKIPGIGDEVSGYLMGAGMSNVAQASANDVAADRMGASADAAVAAASAKIMAAKDAVRGAMDAFGSEAARIAAQDQMGDYFDAVTGRARANAKKRQEKEDKDVGGGGARTNDQLRERQKLYDETRTAAEKYAIEQAHLNELLKAGVIDQEIYDRKMVQLKEQYTQAGKFAASMAGTIKDAMSGLFDTIWEGGGKAAEALGNLGKKLASMALQQSVFQMLARFMPGTFGAGGFIDLTANAVGNAFSGGRVTAFATGGVVSSPTLFPMANGAGLMGEAGPEGILPLTRIGGKLGVHAKGGGGTVVQVINKTGQPVREERQTGADGREIVRMIVGEEIGKGAFSKQMASRYATKDRIVKR
ncbi:phage tail length tape measure family protein [Paenirhodobacter sp. CAU 1674]|uniref:phage tail length tape measure family protein n=1 Tax=Paenirhodobacter sp. CAU 1674 TaxID=3032596 RepID=UPI0031F41DD0